MQTLPGQATDVAEHPVDADPSADGVQHGDEADQTGHQQDDGDQHGGLRLEVVPALDPTSIRPTKQKVIVRMNSASTHWVSRF